MAVARNGYPIRLIQENGNVTELMATRIDMNVTRKTGGKPMPWTGSSRYALDLNVNSAMITIQGVFVDDNIATGGANAVATINLAKMMGPSNDTYKEFYGTGGNLQYLFQGDVVGGGLVSTDGRYWVPSPNVLNGKAISLRDLSDSNPVTAWKDIGFQSANDSGNTDTTAHIAGTDNVKVNFYGNQNATPTTSVVTPRTLALALKACINDRFSTSFAADTEAAYDWEGVSWANAQLTITQVGEVAKTAHQSTVNFSPGASHSYRKPTFTSFTGGRESIKKSAADKVQDLWGVINNSQRGSHWWRKSDTARHWWGKSKLVDMSPTWMFGDDVTAIRPARGDYIIGLQIPYNSMIQTATFLGGSGTDTYVPRNFLVPVGKSKHGVIEGDGDNPFGNKGSVGNTLPADVTFKDTGFDTGIQGTVTKFDVSYDAGENVYVFTMIFAPINRMG